MNVAVSMNTNSNPRPVLRLTSATEATTRREPDPKAVRRALWALHTALFGASVTVRDLISSDDQADRLESVQHELRRLDAEIDHLVSQLGQ
jgi:hypothetical protein